MLGCYVGPAAVAARGVPERFLGPGSGSGSGSGAAEAVSTSTPVESKGRAEIEG